jgi:hypothetical protein
MDALLGSRQGLADELDEVAQRRGLVDGYG